MTPGDHRRARFLKIGAGATLAAASAWMVFNLFVAEWLVAVLCASFAVAALGILTGIERLSSPRPCGPA